MANTPNSSALHETLTDITDRAGDKGTVGRVEIAQGPSGYDASVDVLSARTTGKKFDVTVAEFTYPSGVEPRAVVRFGRGAIVATSEAGGHKVESLGGDHRLARTLAKPLAPLIIEASRRYVSWSSKRRP